MFTNGPFVRELEERAAAYLGVRHCVAVGSCTAGLMLVLRAADLTGDVLVPSFTFAATAHAVAWNGLRPVFVDIEPRPSRCPPRRASGRSACDTSAILATHIYGTPCDVEGLGRIADGARAQAVLRCRPRVRVSPPGADGRGFGDAEVFSLSPTKVLVAGEGGLIATNDDLLAERCRIGRDYGQPGRLRLPVRRPERPDVGVPCGGRASPPSRIWRSGWTSERQLAAAYRDALEDLPGITFPVVRDGDRSTFKDMTILVDARRSVSGPMTSGARSRPKGSRRSATTRPRSTRCRRIGLWEPGGTPST